MGKLIITEFPAPLRARLEERARRNHCSVSKEAVRLIEQALDRRAPALPPPRLRGGPLTIDEIEAGTDRVSRHVGARGEFLHQHDL